MRFDPLYYPFNSRRMAMYAKNGMVAASQPLAAQAGLEILKSGGNAVDAAIATAICLTVVEPTSNGIGGDAFALVWAKDKLHGINGSGRAPKGISIEAVKQLGYDKIPSTGWIPVTVPGAPGCWAALSERFGKLPFPELFKPAIKYAKEGYPVSPDLYKRWFNKFNIFKKNLHGEQFDTWFQTFAPHGKAPEIGEIWNSPDHAKTLQSIADTKAESFYRGELADQIDRFSRKYDGFLRKEDLAEFQVEWVEPVSVNYRGYDVWEIPPNGQGVIALMALNILKQFSFTARDETATIHTQIEAVKLAFVDGLKHITDKALMDVSVKDLLSESFAIQRKALIGDQALLPTPGELLKGGTVYLAAADGEGNMVSFIQSNAGGFGSGLVVPGTGIALQNRGGNFSLDPTHANRLAPGKKTYHTIIPGFLTKNGQPIGPFGIMGGFMQPQAHVQVLMNMIDFRLNPQAALDAPRWMWRQEKTVMVEPGFPEHIAHALARQGHDIQWSNTNRIFGCGQIIIRADNGVLIGATEPRTDGEVASW